MKVNFHNPLDPNTILKADEVHVFTAPGLFSKDNLRKGGKGNMTVLSASGYFAYGVYGAAGAVTFDEDGTFDIRLPRLNRNDALNAPNIGINFNYIPHRPAFEESYDHMVFPGIQTKEKKIIINPLMFPDDEKVEIRLVLSDFVIVPA